MSDLVKSLTAERDALAAQVEALRNLLDNVRRSEEFIVDHAIMLGVDCDLADEIDATLKATPQQHLRELRAEAGRDGCIYGVNALMKAQVFGGEFNRDVTANQYADSIRNTKDGV